MNHVAVRVVIIGGGAAGLATALAAARLGARSVIVLERDYPASGSSGLSAGIFNRQTPTAYEQEIRCFSVGRFAELERVGLKLERTGYVRVARTQADVDRYVAAVARELEFGVHDARVIDVAELGKLVPGMACDDLVGGLYCPSDGHLDGHELCSAYITLAKAEGVEIRNQTALLSAEVGPTSVNLETSRGQLTCDVVVNAAGAWAPQVAELLGTHVPIANQRHEICIAHLPAPLDPPMPIVNTYVPGSGTSSLYMRPEGPGRVLCGLHSYEVFASDAVSDPDNYPRSVSDVTTYRLAEEMLARMPAWDDVQLEPGWAGLYPISPDGLFQIGPHRQAPRVIVAGALGGVGLTVSAAIGQLAAEWAVLGEARTFSFADEYLPDRPTLATNFEEL